MKQVLTWIGLLALSVLYLLEVDYAQLTLYNWIAFAIIALTLLPLLIMGISKAVSRSRARREEELLRQAEKQRRDEEKERRK